MGRTRVSTVVLDAHDAHELAGFYLRLLGYEIRREEPDWVLIGPPPGTEGVSLAFETERAYVPPVWPTRNPGDQQMMLHLDPARGALVIKAGAWVAFVGAVKGAGLQ